jgi:protein phosphatase
MVACPHCHLENPDNNKFCQGCGTSLTHKDCYNCGASVSFRDETCYNCGAAVGTVLWAIIVEQVREKVEQESAQVQMPITGAKGITYANFSLAIEDLNNNETLLKQKKDLPAIGEFLDSAQRYQFMSKENEEITKVFESQDSFCFVQGKVLDSQPLQKFSLTAIKQKKPELFNNLDRNLNKNYLYDNQRWWNLLGVPTFVLPYLSLQQFTPAVPNVYDAWQDKDRGIILLDDRSGWQTIAELWQTEELSPLALAWLLAEMAKLWTPLCAIGCARSLLLPDNLRVDEDRCFSLQKLYLDPPNREYNLKDLISSWQNLLQNCGQNKYEQLDRLLQKVTDGEIEMVKDLRSDLENLFAQTPIELNSDNNLNTQDSPNTEPIAANESVPRSEESNLPAKSDSQDDVLEWIEIENGIKLDEEEHSLEDPTIVLPVGIVNYNDAGYSDIGSQRDHNEDYFGIESEVKKQENLLGKTLHARGFYVVCDGMGGHEAGEVASAMAVKTLQDYFHTHWQQDLPGEKTIADGILLANQTLYKVNLSNSRSGNGRMGTTMVMLLVQDNQFAIAHVGDSRIYRITREGELEKLTTDHEVGQREILRGVEPEIAYGRPDAYQLTQALGPRNDNFVKPDVRFFEIFEDSLLLLCSDGLSDNDFIEKYWQTQLAPLLDANTNLEQGLTNLVEFADNYNGHDNITGVIVRINLRPTA